MAEGIAANRAEGGFAVQIRSLREAGRRDDATDLPPAAQNLHHAIDPEDIHHLAAAIDQILDQVDSAAYRFETYGIRNSATAAEIARLAHECVSTACEALETLEREGVERAEGLTQLCEEVEKPECRTQDRARQAVRELSASEPDSISLMKQKELYELLEATAHCAGAVALVLESVAVKNT